LFINLEIQQHQVVEVFVGEDRWRKTPHGRRLSQKHIDFTLYDRRSLSVVIAIELDDASHDEPSRKARDRFVNEVFRSVCVPLVRIRAASRYSTPTLEQQLSTAIDSTRGAVR
jgi:hypothetical protein